MREARLHLRPYSKPRPHLAIASAVTPYGGKLAGRYDLGMLCVMAGSPNGYDTLDYNWELACTEAAAQGRVMDRANYRVMAPFHIAETREKAIDNVRAGFENCQLYSYSVNPEGGAAIGMPSIEEINEGGRGAIGTPDDALRVLENYWAKTGGFGCILMLAHDWADWEATKRAVRALCAAALRRAQRLALAIDGLDARQSRSEGGTEMRVAPLQLAARCSYCPNCVIRDGVRAPVSQALDRMPRRAPVADLKARPDEIVFDQGLVGRLRIHLGQRGGRVSERTDEQATEKEAPEH